MRFLVVNRLTRNHRRTAEGSCGDSAENKCFMVLYGHFILSVDFQ